LRQPATWSGTLDIYGSGLLEFAGSGGISTIASNAQMKGTYCAPHGGIVPWP
jgi:hypothetical protein